MKEANFEPVPQALQQRIHVMAHDLRKLRENLAAGRVRPENYAAIESAMQTRLAMLEAEVHRSLLAEAKAPPRRIRGMN